jgi:hypothetical protein
LKHLIACLTLVPALAYTARGQDPRPDIVVPASIKARPGHLHKITAQTSLDSLRWINLNDDVDLIPSDTGNWIIIAVNPSNATLRRHGGSTIDYKIAAYGAKATAGKAVPTDPVYITIQVDMPLPPTPPTPPTPPSPPTPPAPIPDAGLRVLVVYDTTKVTAMPAEQQSILFSKELRDFLNAKCPLGPDGKTHEWRIWDASVDATNDPSAALKAAFSRPRASVPWIVASNGKHGFEGPLPATVADTLALLNKYAEGN